MFVHVRLLLERLLAERAVEGALPAVDPVVRAQVVLCGELLAALVAGVGVGEGVGVGVLEDEALVHSNQQSLE